MIEDFENGGSSLSPDKLSATIKQLKENDKHNFKMCLERARCVDVLERAQKFFYLANRNNQPDEKIILLVPPAEFAEIKRSLRFLEPVSAFAEPSPRELFGCPLIVTDQVSALTAVFERPLKTFGNEV